MAIVEFSRHGSRGPMVDITGESKWVKEWGVQQLTGTGMRMHYHLGREIKLRYPEIFATKFDSSMMEAFSTNYNRTISSALSHFTGIFELFDGKDLQFENTDPRLQPPKLTVSSEVDFKSALPHGFQPVPVYSKYNLRILQDMRDDCPNGRFIANTSFWESGERLMKSEAVIKKLTEIALKYGISNLKDINKRVNGRESIDTDTMHFITDWVVQDYYNNPDSKVSKKIDLELFTWASLAYSATMLGYYEDQDYSRAIISELLETILEKLEKKAKDPNSITKYIYYSGHEDLMMVVGVQAGIINKECIFESVEKGQPVQGCNPTPQLASSFVWELHRTPMGEASELGIIWSVKTRYNTDYVDFCGKKNKNEDFECSLAEFRNRIEKITKSDWRVWCVKETEQKDKVEELKFWGNVMVGSIWTLIILSLLSTCLLVVVYRLKDLRNGESKSELDSNL